MADQYTHADALRVYLSGAVADGDAQTDPALSLGCQRSGTEEVFLTPHLINPIRGLRVDYVSGANGEGNGAITVADADNLRWLAPSGTQGAAVEIANGETKILEDGTTASKYIRVTRTSASDLQGTCIVRLRRVFNNALGGANVTSAQRTAGVVSYRALAFKNVSASPITGFRVWRDSASTQLALAHEVMVDGHFFDGTTGGELAEPPGMSWNANATANSGVQVGTLAAGATVMIWIRRTIAADADASAKETNLIHWEFEQ